MKILITGNMGYVGPAVVAQLRSSFPDATLIGYDIGYFAACLTNAPVLPESKLDMQVFGDVRTIPVEVLEGINAIVHLAAISNDPMGFRYEDVTLDVNYRSSVRIAKLAKTAGVKTFVFASSCSVYGAAGNDAKTENSPLNPLTAYAKSKISTETELQPLADSNFQVTCLRFATACGMSDRLRLDLVLNDFVASAISTGAITILSDGSPWRPLIHIRDMARAIDWALTRGSSGDDFLTINAGSNDWNYQVKEIAETVAEVIPGTTVSLNKNAAPDKRSYRASFDLFKSMAPSHQPKYTLRTAIEELYSNLEEMNFRDGNFRNSQLMRLKILTHLQETGEIDSELNWTYKKVGSKKNKLEQIS